MLLLLLWLLLMAVWLLERRLWWLRCRAALLQQRQWVSGGAGLSEVVVGLVECAEIAFTNILLKRMNQHLLNI